MYRDLSGRVIIVNVFGRSDAPLVSHFCSLSRPTADRHHKRPRAALGDRGSGPRMRRPEEGAVNGTDGFTRVPSQGPGVAGDGSQGMDLGVAHPTDTAKSPRHQKNNTGARHRRLTTSATQGEETGLTDQGQRGPGEVKKQNRKHNV